MIRAFLVIDSVFQPQRVICSQQRARVKCLLQMQLLALGVEMGLQLHERIRDHEDELAPLQSRYNVSTWT